MDNLFIEDFIPDLFVPQKFTVQQLTSSISMKSKGHIHWRFLVHYSSVLEIIPEARLIPEAVIRLFSPQDFVIQHQSG